MRRDEGFTPAAAKSAEATADILPGFNGEEEGEDKIDERFSSVVHMLQICGPKPETGRGQWTFIGKELCVTICMYKSGFIGNM